MNDWQTIDSAPDDTPVLVFGPLGNFDLPACRIATCISGLWYVDGVDYEGGNYAPTPTHWMPLPDPPVASFMNAD